MNEGVAASVEGRILSGQHQRARKQGWKRVGYRKTGLRQKRKQRLQALSGGVAFGSRGKGKGTEDG